MSAVKWVDRPWWELVGVGAQLPSVARGGIFSPAITHPAAPQEARSLRLAPPPALPPYQAPLDTLCMASCVCAREREKKGEVSHMVHRVGRTVCTDRLHNHDASPMRCNADTCPLQRPRPPVQWHLIPQAACVKPHVDPICRWQSDCRQQRLETALLTSSS